MFSSLIFTLALLLVGFTLELNRTLAVKNSLLGVNHLPVDVSRLMFNLILEASLDNSFRAYLPFGLLDY